MITRDEALALLKKYNKATEDTINEEMASEE